MDYVSPEQAFPDMARLDLNELQDRTNWERNGRILSGHHPRCRICNRPIKDEQRAVWIREHCGGGTIVTEADGDTLSASGFDGWDLGGQAIGPECAKKHREALKPYVKVRL